MNAIQFYRVFLWVPLALPLIAIGAYAAGLDAFFIPADFLLSTLALSGLFGGLPYLLLATATTVWMKNKDLREIRSRAKKMPLLLIPLYALGALGYGVVGEGSWTNGAALALIGALYILLLGYAYVGLAFLTERLLSRCGCIAHEGV
jgi:hypothetical protein